MSEHPNPGSWEAALAGCTCPVLDNRRGREPPRPDGWWIADGCPLHGHPDPDHPDHPDTPTP